MGSHKGSTVPVVESNHVQDNAGSPGTSPERSYKQRIKVTEILDCCQDPWRQNQLARLATSAQGLIDDEVRRLACMFEAHLSDQSS